MACAFRRSASLSGAKLSWRGGGEQNSGTGMRRENEFAYPPPRSETERGRGTTRSVVEGACGAEVRGEAEAPPTALMRGYPPRYAGRDKHVARRETCVCVVGRRRSNIVLPVCRD
jgi:hypothetical protein